MIERDFYWINPQSVVIPKGKLLLKTRMLASFFSFMRPTSPQKVFRSWSTSWQKKETYAGGSGAYHLGALHNRLHFHVFTGHNLIESSNGKNVDMKDIPKGMRKHNNLLNQEDQSKDFWHLKSEFLYLT